MNFGKGCVVKGFYDLKQVSQVMNVVFACARGVEGIYPQLRLMCQHTYHVLSELSHVFSLQ